MYENGNRNNCKKNKNKDEKSMYRKGNKISEKNSMNAISFEINYILFYFIKTFTRIETKLNNNNINNIECFLHIPA